VVETKHEMEGITRELVVGMAVVWLVVDEAHIATIAVHPEFRGRGLGKRLLAVILEDSRRQGMATATLEVRAGNQTAQAMYRDFGFEVKGLRKGYYKDNQEDALIMTADLLQTAGISETPKVSRPVSGEGEWYEF
jgi:ribosomal-protein-alanine N-acetyltransferase